MTELTPAEVLVIEQDCREANPYSPVHKGKNFYAFNEGYLAAALPRELLLKQERERAGKLVQDAEMIIRKLTGIGDFVTEDVIKILTHSLTQYKAK